MIDTLYKKIAAQLKEIKPCTIYKEDVPQHFAQPSFLISFYEQTPSLGINGRIKNVLNVDISYFPESKTKEECLRVGQEIVREFQIPEFKIRNRNMKIVDNVLHYFFDVPYREYRENNTVKMQEINEETNIKEV